MRQLAMLCAAACLLALPGCTAPRSGVVLHHDDWSDTLRIGDEIYHVTPDAQLYDDEGRRIGLREVPTLSDPGVGVRRAARAHVDFHAYEEGGRRHLDRLWVRPFATGP